MAALKLLSIQTMINWQEACLNSPGGPCNFSEKKGQYGSKVKMYNNINNQLDAKIIVLLIILIGLTCFGR